MDEALKWLAEAGLGMDEAESALAAGAHQGAQDALDGVDERLAGLRERWPALGGAERRIIGPAAREIRARRDAAAARVPRHRALAVGAAEADPEEAAPE